MTSTLDVVNNCLATLGEVPLSSLSESHELKNAALRYLERADVDVQGKGWWYNTEELTLTPAPVTSHMTIPGDALKVSTGFKSLVRSRQTKHDARYVQRGTRLYDLVDRTFAIAEDEIEVQIVRRVALADLPQVVADHVNDVAVYRFQSHYDGDSNKRKELAETMGLSRMELRAEETRQAGYNAIHTNPTLARLKAITNSSRYIRGR